MTDKMQVNLRQVAMEILYEVQKNNGLLHVVLSDALKKYQYLDKNERSFISRLVQGTEERKIELDYIIDSFSKTPVKKQKDVIRIILEMSVYQLKYMSVFGFKEVAAYAIWIFLKTPFTKPRSVPKFFFTASFTASLQTAEAGTLSIYFNW